MQMLWKYQMESVFFFFTTDNCVNIITVPVRVYLTYKKGIWGKWVFKTMAA